MISAIFSFIFIAESFYIKYKNNENKKLQYFDTQIIDIMKNHNDLKETVSRIITKLNMSGK